MFTASFGDVEGRFRLEYDSATTTASNTQTHCGIRADCYVPKRLSRGPNNSNSVSDGMLHFGGTTPVDRGRFCQSTPGSECRRDCAPVPSSDRRTVPTARRRRRRRALVCQRRHTYVSSVIVLEWVGRRHHRRCVIPSRTDPPTGANTDVERAPRCRASVDDRPPGGPGLESNCGSSAAHVPRGFDERFEHGSRGMSLEQLGSHPSIARPIAPTRSIRPVGGRRLHESFVSTNVRTAAIELAS